MMRIFTFRCSNKPDLFAVSEDPAGGNLPTSICTGKWERHSGPTETKPGDHIAGFVSRDLFRDLEVRGFHIASGVRVTVSDYQTAANTAVSGAISAANMRTGFFPTDADA